MELSSIQIATFGTMAARAVVRDVARALGKPYALGDKFQNDSFCTRYDFR